MRGYQQELATLGEKLSEKDFAITLLTSLPDTWDAFISTIDTTTLEFASRLIARILEQDRRMHEKIGKTDDSALTGKDKGKKKKYNPRVTCFNCGKRGHIATDCRSPKKEGARPKDRANEATDVSATDDLFAFPVVEEAYPATDPNTWLADSGCTSHITKSRDYFVDFTETPGHQIHGLGNIAALG